MESKDILDALRRKLRKEVGFGCPVEGCGSPYLSWHHFDPPWEPKHWHNPDGLIALCLHHHKAADKGAYSIEQLRYMKAHPFLLEGGRLPGGSFPWKRKHLVVMVAGFTSVDSTVLLRIRGKDIVWLSRDTLGHQLLNLDLFDSRGTPILSMRDNDWILHAHVEDFECPPSTHALLVKSDRHNTRLEVKFLQKGAPDLLSYLEKELKRSDEAIKRHRQRKWPGTRHAFDESRPGDYWKIRAQERFALIKGMASEEPFAICRVEGHLVWPLDVTMFDTHVLLPGENLIAGAFIGGCAVAVSVG